MPLIAIGAAIGGIAAEATGIATITTGVMAGATVGALITQSQTAKQALAAQKKAAAASTAAATTSAQESLAASEKVAKQQMMFQMVESANKNLIDLIVAQRSGVSQQPAVVVPSSTPDLLTRINLAIDSFVKQVVPV
jgi:uncharacterized protein YjaG (DUF416 family)